MKEIRIKQIEISGRRFEVIKSSSKNACINCELLDACQDKRSKFIVDFCSKNLTDSECFKEIKE